jgi:hypothetical protein
METFKQRLKMRESVTWMSGERIFQADGIAIAKDLWHKLSGMFEKSSWSKVSKEESRGDDGREVTASKNRQGFVSCFKDLA